MRITAGFWRGRILDAPKGAEVRPMTDKVRAALFNVVGPVGGALVLDAYAGSGAVGLEALSRGAAQAEAVESGRSAARSMHRNIDALGASWGLPLRNVSVKTWLSRQADSLPRFDLVVADPPYDSLDQDELAQLSRHLIRDGVMVVSHSSRLPAPNLRGMNLVQTRRYGDSSLSFYHPA